MRLRLLLTVGIMFLCFSFDSPASSQEIGGQIVDAAWSPDGSQIAVAYSDGVHLLDADTQESNLIYSATRISSIAWSPLDDHLAVASNEFQSGSITIIDTSGAILLELTSFNFGDQFTSLTWSPDSTLLAAYVSKNYGSLRESWIEIWTMPTGDLYNAYYGIGGGISWSPNGQYLASLGNSLHIIDLLTDDVLFLPNESINGLDWNPDSNTLVTSHEDGRLQFWDSSGNIEKTIETEQVSEVAWNPDGDYVASIASSRLDIWDYATENNTFSLSLDSSGRVLAWSPDGESLVYDNLNMVEILELQTCDHDIPAADTATLISTITTANGTGNPATICLAADSTYTFTTANNYLNALPYITGDITIEGNNATITRSGTEAFRFFEVETGGKLTLNDLTLSNGDVTGENERGGALMNDGGDITLNNVTFNANSGDTGGAIDNEDGTLTINDSTFTNNTGVYGGAIDNDDVATLTISGSTFTTNTASENGGAIHNDGGTLTVSDTTFTSNSADEYGGAIDNDDGTVTLNASIFTANSSNGGGAIRNDGTLTINAGSAFNTNAADNLGWGGAIYNKSGTTLIINATSFSGNTAADTGGAIRNQGSLTINTGSSFDANVADDYGGAIYNTGGTVNLTGVDLSNNTATALDAGAIYGNSSSSLTITDSTLSDNDSGRRGGAIWSSGTASLTNVHITNNTATVEGGGVYGSSSATISAGNSCISGNSSRAVYSASSSTQNFENNWWGATNGPSGSGSGSGDAVNSKIDYTPFITTACPLS